ncbi:MAG: YecH family protein [Bacteroidales bacterium]|nr:YecH family protein [Bacteroidales bacterium]MCQ2608714.1 YecH family protein [Bacteroidales bacterium]
MTHGREIIAMFKEQEYNKETLVQAIIEKYGENERFYTCSEENLTASGLVDFFIRMNKFTPTNNGFKVNTCACETK